ncbi:uncharacterized protein LOC105168956 [Sesamum indicum]|uniref:Uncharacterized protein LOC105168956 n=1 Tax=Sesamum indicum TaxID=4182 RepID=A0A6I9TRV3_SESIN|nr:uncharacterized protein LOC105168956 [Sesamum indicum]XP_011087490.1 uncharacterized protein LOC105168956 [Sesamum indicum]XP_020551871.1 uncharacterized protein LOC105168956 [Sesamum indicum]
MDNYSGPGLSTMSKPMRKRRSNLNRRPPNESQSPQEYRDSISLSSTPSDHVSDAPSEGNVVHEAMNWTKGLTSNQCISRASYTNLADAETVHNSYDMDRVFEESNSLNRSIEDNTAAASCKILTMSDNKMSEMLIGSVPSGQPGMTSDGIGTGSKFNKVKLKVGGVTHTIHTRSSSDGSSVAGTSATKSTPSDTIYPPHKLGHQENFDPHYFMGEKGGLRGVPWKDFSKIGFSFRKVDTLRVDAPEESVKPALKLGRSSKSKSIIKKYSSDEVYDVEDDEDDDEIRYLQKLKTSRIASYDNTEYEDDTRGKKLRKISRVMDRNIDGHALGIGDYDSSRSGKENKKSRSVRASEDTDYMEEEESVSDGEIEQKNKKQKKEPIDVSEYSKKESLITTRRRAILTGRDISPGLGASLIQFPDGLPPAPPRKPKEQLSEVEQQLKRAEAAQRRRIQNEKAARESEAEAIRKILGQDSSRKRREEKIKKRQEELAQERTANAATVASNVVRWVMGPSGTVVTFPDEIGLPSIFEPKLCSYPPPREKCAGPSCTNTYKYRDSKSKLPLCSLQCYKAINAKAQLLPAW